MIASLGTGRFIELVRHHGWEFVRRRNASAVVGSVAVTPAGDLLLVEQHRIPVGCRVIELPAGLVGDEQADEDLLTAAARELEEETGWRAGRCQVLGRGPSSAGLTDEVSTLIRASDLVRVGAGGGVPGEGLTVHSIPLTSVPAWLADQATSGLLIDHKIHAALWWLSTGEHAVTGRQRMIDLSTWLSWALRHDPQAAGIILDQSGWTSIEALLVAATAQGRAMSREELDEMVATSDTKRFAVSPDGLRIRAHQGHSVPVDLELKPQVPPELLFHGTTDRFLDSILREGLQRQARHQVRLSAEPATAMAVGTRHGTPVILEVDAAGMLAAGHLFFRSDNGVWLVDAVPPPFLNKRR